MPGFGGDEFDKSHFPPIKDPADEETGIAELYPESIQDEINEIYLHNKVLPRIAGVDYTKDKEDDTNPNSSPANLTSD